MDGAEVSEVVELVIAQLQKHFNNNFLGHPGV